MRHAARQQHDLGHADGNGRFPELIHIISLVVMRRRTPCEKLLTITRTQLTRH
jgi:hypothetical protein